MQKSQFQKLANRYYRTYGKQDSRKERDLSIELAKIMQCRWEINCAKGFGRVDCLSKYWLIECKISSSHGLKGALGQLLIYKYALNHRGNLALGIINNNYPETIPDFIINFCRNNGIFIFRYSQITHMWELYLTHHGQPKSKESFTL